MIPETVPQPGPRRSPPRHSVAPCPAHPCPAPRRFLNGGAGFAPYPAARSLSRSPTRSMSTPLRDPPLPAERSFSTPYVTVAPRQSNAPRARAANRPSYSIWQTPPRASSLPRSLSNSVPSSSPQPKSFTVAPTRSSNFFPVRVPNACPGASYAAVRTSLSPSHVPIRIPPSSCDLDFPVGIPCAEVLKSSDIPDTMEKIRAMTEYQVYRSEIPQKSDDTSRRSTAEPDTILKQTEKHSEPLNAPIPTIEPVPVDYNRFSNVRSSVYPDENMRNELMQRLSQQTTLTRPSVRLSVRSESKPASFTANRPRSSSAKGVDLTKSLLYRESPSPYRSPLPAPKRGSPQHRSPIGSPAHVSVPSRRTSPGASSTSVKTRSPSTSRSPSVTCPSKARQPRSAATSPIATFVPSRSSKPVGLPPSTSSGDSNYSTPCANSDPRNLCASSGSCATSTQTYGLRSKRLSTLGKNLLNAAQEGRTEAVRKLLNAGANTDFTFGSKWTPLHRASAKAHADVVSLLLGRGADVKAKTCGYTALHMAAYNDTSGRCVSLLIDAGSEIDCGNNFGRTPLHYAAEYGNEAAVRALVAAGACKAAKDKEGRTPFDIAKTHCVKRLLAPYCNRGRLSRFCGNKAPS